MKTSLILAFYFFIQGEIPFKNSDEFQVQVDLKFKQKESEYKPNSYNTNGMRLDEKGPSEPFLCINITQLKILNDEVKIQAYGSKSRSMLKRKSSADDIHLEMGFVSDLKKGEGDNKITVFFLSAEKKELRKIDLTVLTDGTFQVNGKWHGKF